VSVNWFLFSCVCLVERSLERCCSDNKEILGVRVLGIDSDVVSCVDCFFLLDL
jgi:hypothetical protein